jgi:prephenate dehydratase
MGMNMVNLKVAFLGPSGTFCEQATLNFFKSKDVSLIDCKGMHEIFKKVENKKADYGVVPVENSTEGSVNIALDLLSESELYIFGEIEERVNQNIIVETSMELMDIQIVYSHPQALAQCRDFIEKNLPKAELRETSSTAIAVKDIKGKKNAAAIGSNLAAEVYEMKILAEGIEDNKNNFTRFIVLAKNDGESTGNDRTSIIFSVKHIPGALHDALSIFANRKINLTKIESRPNKNKPWEYVFFCDFEGHKNDKILQEALDELKQKAAFLKILGSYPRFVKK